MGALQEPWGPASHCLHGSTDRTAVVTALNSSGVSAARTSPLSAGIILNRALKRSY